MLKWSREPWWCRPFSSTVEIWFAAWYAFLTSLHFMHLWSAFTFWGGLLLWPNLASREVWKGERGVGRKTNLWLLHNRACAAASARARINWEIVMQMRLSVTRDKTASVRPDERSHRVLQNLFSGCKYTASRKQSTTIYLTCTYSWFWHLQVCKVQ